MKRPPANVVTEHETYGVKRTKYTFSKSEILDCLIKKHNIPIYKEGASHSFYLTEGSDDRREEAVLIVNYKQKESE